MRYALHQMGDHQFESLVVELCHHLFGHGVQEFAQGPDGGRDAKFVGTAERFPSSSSPWTGTTIIQAKHTISPIGKYSEPSFCNTKAKSSVLTKEIPRIKRLVQDGCSNYLMVSNRRLGAEADDKIVTEIKLKTGASNVHLIGTGALERHIKYAPHLAATLSQFEFQKPLSASPDDIARVINALVATKLPESPILPDDRSIRRLRFKEKNSLNGVSDTYARYIQNNYERDFSRVRAFLENPQNYKVLHSYEAAVGELGGALAAYAGDFETFDKALDALSRRLCAYDPDLQANSRLFRVVFFYMYWICDIGTPVKVTS